MRDIILTMGGKEYGWSRHNREGIFRDYDAEADRLVDSAKSVGLECIKFDNDYILNWDKYEENKETLQRVGFGFAFKPIIFHEMLKEMENGDVALFVDSNHIIAQKPEPFFAWTRQNSIFARDHIWTYYPNKDWTKRDTFVNMGCDEERYWNAPQIHCCVTGVCKNDFSVKFIDEYLKYCLDSRVTFGEDKYPNFPSFRENRHNQSVFSIMIEKYKIPYINRTQNVWSEYIIPEKDFITTDKPVDNTYRKEIDERDLK